MRCVKTTGKMILNRAADKYFDHVEICARVKHYLGTTLNEARALACGYLVLASNNTNDVLLSRHAGLLPSKRRIRLRRAS